MVSFRSPLSLSLNTGRNRDPHRRTQRSPRFKSVSHLPFGLPLLLASGKSAGQPAKNRPRRTRLPKDPYLTCPSFCSQLLTCPSFAFSHLACHHLTSRDLAVAVNLRDLTCPSFAFSSSLAEESLWIPNEPAAKVRETFDCKGSFVAKTLTSAAIT